MLELNKRTNATSPPPHHVAWNQTFWARFPTLYFDDLMTSAILFEKLLISPSPHPDYFSLGSHSSSTSLSTQATGRSSLLLRQRFIARAMTRSTCRLLWRARVILPGVSSPHRFVSQQLELVALSILPNWRRVKERSARKSMARHGMMSRYVIGRAAAGLCQFLQHTTVTRATRGLDGPWWTTGLDIKCICCALYNIICLVSFGSFSRSMAANGA